MMVDEHYFSQVKFVNKWLFDSEQGIYIVPNWLRNELMISLYGLDKSSPRELTFEVELGLGVISLHDIKIRSIMFGLSVQAPT